MAVKRTYRINLRNYGAPPSIQLSQYDEGYDLVFEVWDGPTPSATLAAYTVKLIGTRADSLGYEFTGTIGGTSNNVLSFTIDNTISAVAGRGTAEIQIIDSQNNILFASFNMSVFVEKAAHPNDTIDADVEEMQTLYEQIEEMVSTAEANVEAAAEAQIAEFGDEIAGLNEQLSVFFTTTQAEIPGNTDWPYGWRNGYYDGTTGEWGTSQRFICTRTIISLDGVTSVRLVPPSGLAISANAYKADNSFVTYGNANTSTYPENANKEVTFDASEYVSCTVTVGRLSSADASTKAVDSEFVTTIGVILSRPSIPNSAINTSRTFTSSDFGKPADAGAVGDVKDNIENALDAFDAEHNNVTIPCVNSDISKDGADYSKYRNVITVNGTPEASNTRLCIYGTFAYSSTAPSYANRPTWYNSPLASFVVGHKYKMGYKVIGGTINKGSVEGDCYFDLRTNSGSKELIGGGSPIVWECTFQPEMIAFVVKAWAYTNATLALFITDVTDDAQEENELPYYWESYINEKAQTLAQDNAPPIGGGTRFIFITDTHMRSASGEPNNAGFSPALMKYLHDNASIGLAFFGGDAITGGYATQAAAVDDLMYFRKVFDPVWEWMYSIFGNHEYGNNSSDIQRIEKSTIYNVLERDKELRYADLNPVYGSYVVDSKAEKIRYICTNLNEGSNLTQQASFFCNTLADTPSGWTVVIFTHFSLTWDSESETFSISEKLTATNSIIPIIEAYNARGSYSGVSFASAGAEVACMIGGHCHRDGMVKTDGGVPVIATTCDRFYGYEERELGTTAEHAFDVVTINTTDKIIDMMRIGYGSDRSFTYGGGD